MKFVLGYRTELFMIFLVPIQALQWYRFLRYSGTGSCATMVPFDRYYQSNHGNMRGKDYFTGNDMNQQQ